jgi:hypothetical protein
LNIEVLGDRIWKRGISGWGLVLHSKKWEFQVGGNHVATIWGGKVVLVWGWRCLLGEPLWSWNLQEKICRYFPAKQPRISRTLLRHHQESSVFLLPYRISRFFVNYTPYILDQRPMRKVSYRQKEAVMISGSPQRK